MTEWTTQWCLSDLARTAPGDPGRPDELAYRAMHFLVADAFASASRRYRERRIHRLGSCGPDCDLCPAVVARHVAASTRKLQACLRGRVPQSRGEPVRDWLTIRDAVTGPSARTIPLRRIRDGFGARLRPDDPELRLVFAFSTQLGLRAREQPGRSGAPGSARSVRGPRLVRDIVNDHLAAVLATEQGWAVKPRRDLAERRDLQALARHRPAGARLLDEILRRLELGVPDAFERVVGEAGARGDVEDLRQLVTELLAQPAGDWFRLNVIARQHYNDEAAREARARTRLADPETAL